LYNGCTKRKQVRNEAYEIQIPKGTKTGDEVKASGESTSNEIIFVISEQPHNSYTRDGNNLKYTAVVYPHEWLLGCSIVIPLLDNKTKRVQYRGVLSGRITERGLGMINSNGRKGDLIITASFVPPQLLATTMSIGKLIFGLWLMTIVWSNPSLLLLILFLRQMF
jgi:DnaJ-class molecular chaperone